MRISLLLEREPFGDMLAETLSRFWSRQLGQQVRADWFWNPSRRQILGNGEDRRWLCNVYLNAIFPAGIDRRALEPIRREFSRSVVAWRRPLQKAYVSLALAPRLAHYFTHALLRVVPGIASLDQQVIVPGNSLVRILDRQADCAYGVLKAGYSRERFGTRISARQRAATLDIPIPELVKVDLDAGWFQEQYIEGTPLNRLACEETMTRVTQEAVGKLQRLADETREETALDDYVDGLRTRIHRHLAIMTLQSPTRGENAVADRADTCGRAAEACDQLMKQVIAASRANIPLLTAQTHGDFQPGNILVDGERFWIIDWEYASRRQALYDTFTFSFQARAGNGVAQRLQQFVTSGTDQLVTPEKRELIRTTIADRSLRRRHASLFLLEELELRLAENTHPRLTAISSGLRQLLNEIKSWRSFA